MDLGTGKANAYGKSHTYPAILYLLWRQITADSISAFEKLIEAYGKIGDIVSRLDRLGDALVNDHNFQNVLALVYSDIVEFHRRAYKFVKRKCKYTSSLTLCRPN